MRPSDARARGPDHEHVGSGSRAGGRRLSRWLRSPAAGAVVGAAAVAACTALIYPLAHIAAVDSLGVVYLLAVLLVSVSWSFWLGLLTAVASAASFDFFHIPPGGFAIAGTRNVGALVVFLIAALIAVVVAALSERVRLRRDDTAPSSLEDSGPDPRASHRMSAETRIHTFPASRSRSAIGRPSQSRPRVDERLLFRRWHSTRAVADRDAIVDRFLPLARQLALRYSGRLEPFEDLYQVACLALVKAVERYEPERPEAFSSYAVPSILGELKRHFRDRTWVIRVPRALQELAVTVQRTEAQMAADLGRRPTVAELARATSATEGAVRDALRALDARSPGSLDRPVAHADGEGNTVGERLGAEESGYRQAEHRAHVDRLLERLSDRHRTVIRLRFVEDLTQREIGARIGVSHMDAYRLLRQALDLMYEEELRPRARVAGL